MPIGAVQLSDLARAVPVSKPGIPPHFHIELLEYRGGIKVPAATVRQLPREAWQQDVYAIADRAPLSCELFGCEWWRDGRVGIVRDDSGREVEFQHPAGVECGDFGRCKDPECPCPDRVLRWPDGTRKGHLSACRYCLGTFRRAVSAAPVKAISREEAWDRVHEGAETLQFIHTRGL